MNETMAAQLDAVHTVLTVNGDLPTVLAVQVTPHVAMAGEARMHMSSAGDVAMWADRYGVPVRLRDRSTYVECAAELTPMVSVWALLRHSAAYDLTSRLGVDEADEAGVETEPRLLLAVVPTG